MLPCLIILNLCTPGSRKSKSYAKNAVPFLAVCRFSKCADNLPIPLTTAYSRLNPERDRQQFRARGLFFWQYLGQRNQLGRLGESLMRRNWLIAAAFILLMSGPSFSQAWTQYTSRTDFFAVDFPGEPKVQDISYGTEYGITLPGRVYTYARRPFLKVRHRPDCFSNLSSSSMRRGSRCAIARTTRLDIRRNGNSRRRRRRGRDENIGGESRPGPAVYIFK